MSDKQPLSECSAHLNERRTYVTHLGEILPLFEKKGASEPVARHREFPLLTTKYKA
jgi:hypothetical protein